jgi:hypothetical protein
VNFSTAVASAAATAAGARARAAAVDDRVRAATPATPATPASAVRFFRFNFFVSAFIAPFTGVAAVVGASRFRTTSAAAAVDDRFRDRGLDLRKERPRLELGEEEEEEEEEE